MKAIRIHSFGGPDVLSIDTIDEPNCPNDKVKIKIMATSLNHLDLWIRMGILKNEKDLPLILGSDASGIIVEVGKEISNWSIGDEIVIQPGIFCGECKFCIQDKENYCIEYGIRYRWK